MGTTLTGTQINNTYDGLIKTTDNTAITATTKLISDGLGNDTCIKVGTAGTDFLGNVDFSAATVTGLPGGAAGLESGTGTDSMQSAASLTTVAANASGNLSIALGDGAQSPGTGAIAIGDGADAGIGADPYDNNNTIAIGVGANIANYTSGIAIGRNASTSGAFGFRKTAIGTSSFTSAQDAISIGTSACSLGANSIVMGRFSCASSSANQSVAIGCNARVLTGDGGVALGNGSSVQTSGTGSVAIGKDANTFANAAIGIGWSACANACGAVALGFNLLATRAFTTASCQYEALEAGKGIVVTSPDGLTTLGIGIDNTGAIVTYTP